MELRHPFLLLLPLLTFCSGQTTAPDTPLPAPPLTPAPPSTSSPSATAAPASPATAAPEVTPALTPSDDTDKTPSAGAMVLVVALPIIAAVLTAIAVCWYKRWYRRRYKDGRLINSTPLSSPVEPDTPGKPSSRQSSRENSLDGGTTTGTGSTYLTATPQSNDVTAAFAPKGAGRGQANLTPLLPRLEQQTSSFALLEGSGGLTSPLGDTQHSPVTPLAGASSLSLYGAGGSGAGSGGIAGRGAGRLVPIVPRRGSAFSSAGPGERSRPAAGTLPFRKVRADSTFSGPGFQEV